MDAGLLVLRESRKEVPVATGNLRNSGYVAVSNGKTKTWGGMRGKGAEKMQADRDRAVSSGVAEAKAKRFPAAVIGYSAVYALSVHENRRSGRTGGVSPRGKRYTSGRTESGRKSTRVVWAEKGKWKFLEDPLKRLTKEIVKAIKRRARKATMGRII